MLIACKNGRQVNLHAIREVAPDEDGGGSVVTLPDGAVYGTELTPEELWAMGGTALPASGDFLRLIYRFNGDPEDFERHPVIGWRVRGAQRPEPITPSQDGYHYEDCCEAVRYPDGKVIDDEVEEVFSDIGTWLRYAQEQRIEWLKAKGSSG